MKMILRWFGGMDSVPLKYIAQTPGISGVATSLMDIPVGEIWSEDRLFTMKEEINSYGLEAEVIESVNVHEDIKLGLPSRDEYLENYIKTIENLSKIGVKVICYNFMPVLDWARSTLNYELPDGSNTMYFDDDAIMSLTPVSLAEQFTKLTGNLEMPGWEPERLRKMEGVLEQYKDMSEEQYLRNMKYFLDAVMPTAERFDIKMAIHPDDPPWAIFGLPRIITCPENIRKFLSLNSSPNNGLTLCTGSLGANIDNDIPAIAREFSDRIYFAHIRNLKFQSRRSFYESSHISSCGSLDLFEIVNALYESGFNSYIRPDHGRMIWGETGRAGYGLYDRALGASYLTGIWETLKKKR